MEKIAVSNTAGWFICFVFIFPGYLSNSAIQKYTTLSLMQISQVLICVSFPLYHIHSLGMTIKNAVKTMTIRYIHTGKQEFIILH